MDDLAYLSDVKRLAALRQAGLLDGPVEEAFDRLTRLAVRILGVPISLVSLVDQDRQFFKSAIGLPEPLASARQTPLSHSFCKHVVLSNEQLIVPDAREHPVLKHNPVVQLGVVAYAGFPIVTSDGHVLGSFCAIDSRPHQWTTDQIDVLRDLTAGVIAEIELRRANDALRQSNEAKGRFIAMLSHDLRTPLSPALLTAAELVADPSLPKHVRGDLQLIHRNIELEVRMIDSLLDMTRIASGKLTLNIETTDVHALLRESLEMCKAEAAARSIAVRLNLKATHSSVQGDTAKLQQVFCNLFKNAIKFSDPGSQIDVRSSDVGSDSLRIDVADNGIGIAADALPHIFDAFEQGEKTVTRSFGGLGLGLAICKGIVEAHGGSLTASSEGSGRGTTISLMLVSAEVPAFKACPPQRKTAALSSFKILLVEDHEDSLHAMSRFLRRLDHTVTTATSVTTALAAAEREEFDLLISDVGLPDGTGLELMEELRARRPLKGIALTGYGTESDIQMSKAAGFGRHLTKPISIAELELAVQTIAMS